MTESARITVALHEGKVEIVGSQDFVTKNIETLEPIIRQMLSAPNSRTKETGTGAAGAGAGAGSDDTAANGNGAGAGDGADWQSKYENVFALAGDKIQVLVDLPGSGTAEKTVNAALLLAFANTLRGQEETSYNDIRELCKAHAALDTSNFSSTLKDEKDAFIISGIAGSPNKTLKLTKPGIKRAEALADSLK